MKILFTLSSMPMGGVEIFSADLAKQIVAKGDRVGIVIFKDEKAQVLDSVDMNGVDVFFAHRRRRLNFLFIFNLCKIIRTFKPDAILSFSGFSYFCTEIANKIAGTGIAHCMQFCLHKPLSVKDRVCMKFFMAFSKLWGSHYISVSKAQAQYHNRAYNISEKKHYQIYHGIDPEMFMPCSNRRGEIFTIAHVANIRPVKDQRTLFKALKELNDSLSDWRLFFAGEGNSKLFNALKDYLVSHNIDSKVTMFGASSRETIKDILSKADVFVLTSLSEGLPIAVLEAMSAGLPCVLTEVGGCPEIVKDGFNGYLVKAGAYRTIAARLSYLYRNPEALQSMGKNAKQTAIEKFNIDRCVEEYRKVFKEITSNNRDG